MKLSTRSRFGARILVELATHQNNGPLPVGQISKNQDITVKYVEQLVRPLKKAGLIKSVRGPKGGHLLAQPPEKISLGQVVRILERHNDLIDCIDSPESCRRASQCAVREAWSEASRCLFEKLDAIHIADLVRST